MNWLNSLEYFNISFHVHTLFKEDFVLLECKDTNGYMIYILEGYAQLLRVFTNNEKICLQILNKKQLTASHYSNNKRTKNYCDLIVAYEETKIITVPLTELRNQQKKHTRLLAKIWIKEHMKYDIVSILSHRNTKKRVIQLLIVLTKRLGCIQDKKVIIPIRLTHQTIANMTGSQRVTVSRIMINLRHKKVIDYNNKSVIIRNSTQLIQA